jgi:sialate O-acetylesterase
MITLFTRRLALAAAAELLVLGAASADVKLPAVIGEHMVLQQNRSVALWGFADPNETVRVKADWRNEEIETKADAYGRWKVMLETPAAGGPHELHVAARNEIVLRDVLVGEVWLCSGQSNMEMPIAEQESYSGVADWREELKRADHPKIRLFNVQNTIAAAPALDCQGRWSACDASSARTFSAVGYFFACQLEKELGVPIGMIEADWGGTPCEAWTSADSIRGTRDFGPVLTVIEHELAHPIPQKTLDAQVAEWRKKIDALDPGMQEPRWSSEGLDDSSWREIDVPERWTGDLARFDGFLWCRRAFDLAPAWAGRAAVLELGPIDDMDVTYVNGAKVGEMMESGRWQTPRVYELPAGALHAGRNVIAVRVLDTGGYGGICGKPDEVRLREKDGGDSIALAGKWRAHTSTKIGELPNRPERLRIEPYMPTVLYNGMIAPIVPFGIRGAIWYQGEANVMQAFRYRSLFPAMIADWRKHFAQGDVPFDFVQIAPFAREDDRGQMAELREAQAMALAVPNTAMAVTMDIGERDDIHPKNKREVGRRLALCALSKTYDRKEVECWGPMYASMKVEGSSIRLSFDHARGLTSHGKALEHFMIAGADQKFADARAKIDGESVVVSSDAVKDPLAVRYCFGAADEGTLFNAAGLPAPSFRTDTWRGLTQTSE